MTIDLLIALSFALLIYLSLVFCAAGVIRRLYPHWRPRRPVAIAFFAGPILVLAIGLVVHWLHVTPADRGGAMSMAHDRAFLAMTALAVLAALPAAAIGYIVAGRVVDGRSGR